MGQNCSSDRTCSSTLRKAAAVVALVSLIFTCIAATSGFESKEHIMDFPWATLEPHNTTFGDLKVYIGLRRFVIEVGDVSSMYPYGDLIDTQCYLTIGGTICSACRDAIDGISGVIVTGLIAHIGSFLTSFGRIFDDMNGVGNRAMSCVTSWLSILSSISAIAAFKTECFDEYDEGHKTLGVAYILTILSMVVDILLGVLHAIAPHDKDIPVFEGTPCGCFCYSTGPACCCHKQTARGHDVKDGVKNNAKATVQEQPKENSLTQSFV